MAPLFPALVPPPRDQVEFFTGDGMLNAMRLCGLVFWVLLSGSSLALAVAPGDSLQDMQKELGSPNGMVSIGEAAIYFYDRGEVSLKHGRVHEVNLMTENELVAKQERDARRSALLQEIAIERRAENEAVGLALKQSKVDSPGFQSLPASERVAYWRHFKLRYPTVPVDLELTAAMTQSRIEQAAAEQAAQDLYWKQAASTRSDDRRTSWFPWFGVSYGSGHGHGKPGKPSHPIHPGRPPHGNKKSDPAYHSKKGSVMATSDRARGSYDRAYSASRSSFYRSVTR